MHILVNSLTRKFFQLKGRANRREYIYLTLLVVSYYFLLVPYVVNSSDGFWVKCIFFLLAIVLFIPSTTITIRRLHDIGWSGKWITIFFMPIILILYFLFSVYQSLNNIPEALNDLPEQKSVITTSDHHLTDDGVVMHSSSTVTFKGDIPEGFIGAIFSSFFEHVFILALISISAIVSNIFTLVLFIKKGTSEANRYGPPQ